MPKFSSFNAFGSESFEIGQSHIPVWLGVVGPVPVGGTLKKDYAQKGFMLPAGSPVNLASKIITPFVMWEVVSYTAATTGDYDTIVIKPCVFGGIQVIPAADDFVQALGATFAATGKAAQVVAVTELTGDDAGKFSFTVDKTANLGSLSAGDVIVPSAAAAAGTGKSIAVKPNGYLYNDIYLGELTGDKDAYTIAATGAVVVNHPDGLLVELTAAAPVKEQMAAAVPGVYQVLV